MIGVESQKSKVESSAQLEAKKRQRDLMWRRVFAQSYLWFLLVLLYAPIVLIILFSFTKSKVLGNWTGFTFALYENLFTGYDRVAQVHVDPNMYYALWYTLIIAVVAATFATLLGTLAAIGIFNMRQKSRKAIQLLNSVPMINPDILRYIAVLAVRLLRHQPRFDDSYYCACGILHAVCRTECDASFDEDESEYLRGSIGLRRDTISSVAESDDAGIMAWNAERIHIEYYAEY